MADRYFLSPLVAFFALAGLGISELRRPLAVFVLALLLALELCDLHNYDRSKHDVQWGVQWREAVEAAAGTGLRVGVEPGLSLEIVHYYLRHLPADRNRFVPDGGPDVLLVADQIPACQPRVAALVMAKFPRVVARFK